MERGNVIQKQIVYFDMNIAVASPFAIQEAATKWCSEVLVDAIGNRLEKYADIEEVIRIDKIEIVLNTGESLDYLLADKIAFEVEREIKGRIYPELKTKHSAIISKHTTLVEAFAFFLQNGYLPWWSNLKIEDLIPAEQFSLEQRSMFKELLKDETIAARFATALPLNIFIGMLSQLFEASEKQVSVLFNKIERLAFAIKDKDLQHQFLFLVKQQFITACVEKKDEPLVIKQAIDLLLKKYQILPEKLRSHIRSGKLFSEDDSLLHILATKKIGFSKKDSERYSDESPTGIVKQKQSEKQLAQKQNGIYVSNAGLVLLAPFILRFFENLGIVVNNLFNSKDMALALLQWLVSGNELYAEYDLVLPKIMCGMEPGEPVIIIPHLPGGFKKEGEILLQSVIEHWSILKNTSIAGLRESFLQREGKLSFQKDEWLLQVEQKPYDMLLEHLPWNISMIRLSWMPYLLRTEWIG